MPYSLRGRSNWDLSPLIIISIGVILFVSIDIISNIIMATMRTTLSNNYGIVLPLWLPIILPSFAIVIMYPKLGVPVVREWIGKPLSQEVIILQMLLGPIILLTLAFSIEFVIILLYQAVNVGRLSPGYAFLALLWIGPTPDVFLGIWSGIVFSWIEQQL